MSDVDELDRTAQQVRLDGRGDSPVHEVAAAWSDPWMGRTYRTVCCHVMTKAEGAILTTRGSTCVHCWRGAR